MLDGRPDLARAPEKDRDAAIIVPHRTVRRDVTAGVRDRCHVALEHNEEVTGTAGVVACPNLLDGRPGLRWRARYRCGRDLPRGEDGLDLRMRLIGGDCGPQQLVALRRAKPAIEIDVAEILPEQARSSRELELRHQ